MPVTRLPGPEEYLVACLPKNNAKYKKKKNKGSTLIPKLAIDKQSKINIPQELSPPPPP